MRTDYTMTTQARTASERERAESRTVPEILSNGKPRDLTKTAGSKDIDAMLDQHHAPEKVLCVVPNCTIHDTPAPNKSETRRGEAQHSPLPWKVMADPSYPEGLHPLHHNRYIATEAMGVEGDDFDGEGSLICALRDQEHQAGDAKLIVRAVNHADKLAEALRDAHHELSTGVMPQVVAQHINSAILDWERAQ